MGVARCSALPFRLREPPTGWNCLALRGLAGCPSGSARRASDPFLSPELPDLCCRGLKSEAIFRVWGVRLEAGGVGEMSVWSPQGGWVLIGDGVVSEK